MNKKYYVVVNKIGNYAHENAGKYEVNIVKGPTMNKGSQVISYAIFNTEKEAKLYKRMLERNKK